MKTYKYPLGKQSNTIRIGNLLDDMWQVHEYFHTWQRQRHKEGLPYVGFEGMCDHVKVLKDTTHPHWKALPSQAIQQELRRAAPIWRYSATPCHPHYRNATHLAAGCSV